MRRKHMNSNTFTLKPIGTVRVHNHQYFIDIDSNYLPALKGLSDFSHIHILWWCHNFDEESFRTIVDTDKPYKTAPDKLGIFATRSPIRPNPIALSASPVIHIDTVKGVIQLAYLDADDGTPVIDIKPYQPSVDRIKDVSVPKWCAHWPKYYEDSENFDWEKEFTFVE